MSLKTREMYAFGVYRLDAAGRVLFRDDQPVPLTPKQIDTLIVLVRAQGAVVDRDRLIKEVWPDTFVEEAGLTRNISALRKALEEGGDGQAYIETLPKRGYRFVAPARLLTDEGAPAFVVERHSAVSIVEETEEQIESDPRMIEGLARVERRSGRVLIGVGAVALVALALAVPAWWRSRAQPQMRPENVRSIAVLPFRHLTSDEADRYLGVGLADLLVTRFGNLSSITVTSTSTALRYEGKDPLAAGKELGVDAVLDGSIQRSDGRLRVTVQLLSVATGHPLWAGSFDEPVAGFFAVEDAVTNSVTGLLAPRLGRDERDRVARRRTQSPDAWQAYLQGRAWWATRTVDDIEHSIQAFESAIRSDPGYALAYAGLAQSLIIQGDYQYRWPRDVYPKAKEAAVRAIELDGSLADAHGALAEIAWEFDWDWSTAEREFARALELNPNDATLHQWRAEFLTAMGRTEESLAAMDRALALDRLAFAPNSEKATLLFYAHRFAESIAQSERTMSLTGNIAIPVLHASASYHALGREAESRAELEKGRKLVGDIPIVTAMTALHDAIDGKSDRALGLIHGLERQRERNFVDPIFIAGAYLAVGDTGRAMQWVQQAVVDRTVYAAFLAVDPTFDKVHRDPRFVETLRQVGLTDALAAGERARH
jgi:DNA-binding winged helix-turn-helix (wHTH) protein/TolB-like protein/Flp pilus assembly protein TadD